MNENNIYEIGYLINPDLSQQEAEKTAEKLKSIAEQKGASVISEGEIVDIDLAYQIITKIASKNERFDRAYFSWLKFELAPEKVSELKDELDKIKSEIFRYLIVKTVADNTLTDKFNPDATDEEAEGEKELDSEEELEEDSPETLPEEMKTLAEDDLTKIEGIGPVTAEALAEKGIVTFADLAEKSSDELRKILSENPSLSKYDPETWPKQAFLAKEGKWEELKEWQEELSGGEESK